MTTYLRQREKKQKHAYKPKSIEIAESKMPKSNLKRQEKSTAPEVRDLREGVKSWRLEGAYIRQRLRQKQARKIQSANRKQRSNACGVLSQLGR